MNGAEYEPRESGPAWATALALFTFVLPIIPFALLWAGVQFWQGVTQC